MASSSSQVKVQFLHPVLRNRSLLEFPSLQNVLNFGRTVTDDNVSIVRQLDSLQVELEDILCMLAIRNKVLTALIAPALAKNITVVQRYNDNEFKIASGEKPSSNTTSRTDIRTGETSVVPLQSKKHPRCLRSKKRTTETEEPDVDILTVDNANERLFLKRTRSCLKNQNIPNHSTATKSIRKSGRLLAKSHLCSNDAPHVNSNTTELKSENSDDNDVSFEEFVSKFCCDIDLGVTQDLCRFVDEHSRDFKESLSTFENQRTIYDEVIRTRTNDDVKKIKRRKVAEFSPFDDESSPTMSKEVSNKKRNISAEILTTELVYRDLHKENYGVLTIFRETAEAQCKETILRKDLDKADEDVIKAYERRKLFKKSQPDTMIVEAKTFLDTRNLILEKLEKNSVETTSLTKL